MRKIFILLILGMCINLQCFGDEIQDVQCFFNEYIEAANSYSSDYFKYYSDDAKIVRVVEKPDGTKEAVNIPLDRYKSEAKKSTKLMKLRKYKNHYFNVRITPFGNYKIPAYFIIGKDSNGNWKIKEESMNTKVQRFLDKD